MLLLASGNTPRQGTPFTIGVGEVMSIFLTPAAGEPLDDAAAPNYSVALERQKESDSSWYSVDRINNTDGSRVLTAPGTFRLNAIEGTSVTFSAEGFLG